MKTHHSDSTHVSILSQNQVPPNTTLQPSLGTRALTVCREGDADAEERSCRLYAALKVGHSHDIANDIEEGSAAKYGSQKMNG